MSKLGQVIYRLRLIKQVCWVVLFCVYAQLYLFVGLIILQAQGGSLIHNTTRAEEKTSLLHHHRPKHSSNTTDAYGNDLSMQLTHKYSKKKEAHASFIRQYKSNIKVVALFLSVITTCRFGLNHKELPL